METIKKAAEMLNNNDRITVLCHRSPDGDTLGSGYALCLGLQKTGKSCRLHCADPTPADLGRLLGSLEGFEGEEQMVVTVDVADAKLLGGLMRQYEGRVDLAIDHHASHRPFAPVICLDSSAAATTQVIHRLLGELEVEIDKRIAACLYIGLATDTGCFRYGNTTPDALRLAARLLEYGIDTAAMNHLLFETKSRARVAVECSLMQTLEYGCGGRCAIMTIPLELLRCNGVGDNELEGVAGLPRQIEGVWVGVTVRENEDGSCRVSVRTTEAVDAGAICAAFGGGGHRAAAGCTLHASLEDAAKQLMSEIERHLENGGNG